MLNRWEIYPTMENGARGHRVRLVAAENGEVLLSGELYARQEDAIALVRRVMSDVDTEVIVAGVDVDLEPVVPAPVETPPDEGLSDMERLQLAGITGDDARTAYAAWKAWKIAQAENGELPGADAARVEAVLSR